MNGLLKNGLLILSLTAVCSFTTIDKVFAKTTVNPPVVSAQQMDEINDKIYAWNEIVKADPIDYEGWANLTLLNYDKGDYKKSYKAAQKAIDIYEKYEITADDDLIRETMVKGAASAYNLGKRNDAQEMLDKMMTYNLTGTKENRDTYTGMANYYLAAIYKDSGNYNQSYYYINNAVTYCPRNHIFLDFLRGFFYLHDSWHWHHHHVHHVTYIMPHHHRYLPPRRPVYRPAPPPRHIPVHRHTPAVHRPNQSMHKPAPAVHHPQPIHKPAPKIARPQSMHKPNARPMQQRPQMSRPTPQQRPQMSRPAPQQRPQMSRPAPQQRPQTSRPAPQQRPQMSHPTPQQRPQMSRPAPQQQYPQMQRPQQGSHPVHRPAQHGNKGQGHGRQDHRRH